MKAARQQDKRATKVPRGCSANICGIRVNKIRRTDQHGDNIKGGTIFFFF